jgi:hypothetical protein
VQTQKANVERRGGLDRNDLPVPRCRGMNYIHAKTRRNADRTFTPIRGTDFVAVGHKTILPIPCRPFLEEHKIEGTVVPLYLFRYVSDLFEMISIGVPRQHSMHFKKLIGFSRYASLTQMQLCHPLMNNR